MKRRKMITGKGMEKSHPQDEITKKIIDHFMGMVLDLEIKVHEYKT